MDPSQCRQRALAALRHYAEVAAHEHGWFYHFIDLETGAPVWHCEISSIDTALLLAGVLTVSQYFKDPEVVRLAGEIYRRVNFHWMLNGHSHLLAHGWKPESGFLANRWDHYCELGILYLLAIGSPYTPIDPASWYAWKRPRMTYAGTTLYPPPTPSLSTSTRTPGSIFGAAAKHRRTHGLVSIPVLATRAHRAFCIDLGKKEFAGCYGKNLWGITASDSARGYVAWGGPPANPAIDGSLVPGAAAGSLMFTPELSLAALRAIKDRFGSRIWHRYGFSNAFHPLNGWTAPDVIGIDLGIALLSAENLRNAFVWRLFMQNDSITQALRLTHLGKPNASLKAGALK